MSYITRIASLEGSPLPPPVPRWIVGQWELAVIHWTVEGFSPLDAIRLADARWATTSVSRTMAKEWMQINTSLTLDELVYDCWNHIHANGWLYQMLPDVHWVALNAESYKYIKNKTKAEFVTSRQVAEALEGLAALEKVAA